MKKSMLLGGLALSATLLLAGCGKSNDVLVVGTNAAFPPFEYVGGQSGDEIKGFDIELAKQIAKDAGKTLKVENMKFDSLIVALNSGKIDFIASGMTITPERQASVNFSEPYYEATQVLLVNKDNDTIHTLDDIKDKHFAVQLGSTADMMSKKYTQNVTAFNTGFEAIMELKNGKVDLVLFDSEPAANYLAKNPDLKLIKLDFPAEFYGFAVSKQQPELLTSINNTLKNLKESGQYQTLVSAHIK
ncbi:basic amino acid ABC transporter substrate-binding protein [Shewanella xiamenensis]|uniref:Basic amino acid ABC transporter substrate-binding protein n=1 Tax=Shewanella xiamenensis TaxID=332186 RepID=A0AAE4Q009_9GAMM|nr:MULTISPECIES: basic amino acid ABC transporter substrate-binding protein [Shewanella]ASF17226.1 basic amino acid ABC transporter substrate-binding protein [Shewanella sp. FDAARGOS_354]KEK29421.1 extracellular solute-binding protein [Shewanella xiamenensis]KPN78648.1 ABC transporter substrate-binding protein [Shewanella sp. Sh95]MBW0280330.1 basic amino acid ABC transporter substrate-binding protein [Shewanella xiamenensis]MBW0297004.1 basic amino acid ABC transporter substrate-binding prote